MVISAAAPLIAENEAFRGNTLPLLRKMYHTLHKQDKDVVNRALAREVLDELAAEIMQQNRRTELEENLEALEMHVANMRQALRTGRETSKSDLEALDLHCDLLIDQLEEGKDDDEDDELTRGMSDWMIEKLEKLMSRRAME